MNRAEIIEILKFGVMAPSTHNTQPWKFLIIDNGVEIYLDSNRLLSQADPRSRDAYISIGCLVENIVISAKENGYYSEVQVTTTEKVEVSKSVTVIHFSRKNENSKSSTRLHFKILPNRINARGLFTNETVPISAIADEINTMTGEGYFGIHSVKIISDKKQLASIAKLTEEGIAEAHHSDAFRKEMSYWMPSALSNRKNGLQWYSLHMPFLLSFFIAKIIKKKDMGHVLATKSADSIRSASVGLVFTSLQESPASWIAVGRSAERIMLFIQSLGFHTSIYVGGIEIGDRSKEFARIIGGEEMPQFFFVAGRITTPHKVSPRESISLKLLN